MQEPAYKLVRVEDGKSFDLTTDQLQAIVFALNRMGVDAPIIQRQEHPVDGAYFHRGG